MSDFCPTHIASLGNSQDSPRKRVAVAVLRPAELPRFYICVDADDKTYTLPDQNLKLIENEPTTKPATVVVPPA
jgi:hypothetical protein